MSHNIVRHLTMTKKYVAQYCATPKNYPRRGGRTHKELEFGQNQDILEAYETCKNKLT